MKNLLKYKQFENSEVDELSADELELVEELEFPLLDLKDLYCDYNLGGRKTFRKISGSRDYEAGFSQWHKDTGVWLDFQHYLYLHILPDKDTSVYPGCFLKYRNSDEVVSTIEQCLIVAKRLDWNYTIRINKLRERGTYFSPSQLNVNLDELKSLIIDFTFRIGIHFWK